MVTTTTGTTHSSTTNNTTTNNTTTSTNNVGMVTGTNKQTHDINGVKRLRIKFVHPDDIE